MNNWDGQRETLDDLAHAVHYNRWIYSLIQPYLGHRIIEIGCGTGNITEFFDDKYVVLATDIHDGYLKTAQTRLNFKSNITFEKVDLEKGLQPLKQFKPETLICINVLEHVLNDFKIIQDGFRILEPGGKFLIFVPALQKIFGSMDISYGHFRRYSKKQLSNLFMKNGFEIQVCEYLNLIGVVGWWFNGQVLKRTIIPKIQMIIYDQMIRWMAPIGNKIPKPFGLSLFCVGVKR